jgi:hypothetical protein
MGRATFSQRKQNTAIATNSIGLSGQLLEKVKEAAAKEKVTRRSSSAVPWKVV